MDPHCAALFSVFCVAVYFNRVLEKIEFRLLTNFILLRTTVQRPGTKRLVKQRYLSSAQTWVLTLGEICCELQGWPPGQTQSRKLDIEEEWFTCQDRLGALLGLGLVMEDGSWQSQNLELLGLCTLTVSSHHLTHTVFRLVKTRVPPNW